MNDGYANQVSLYDVCVGMALVSSEVRELLKDKDQLFAEIHAFGEGQQGEQWIDLIRKLLGDEGHPAVHDEQGDWVVGKKRFSRLCRALVHRLLSIGSYRSLKLAQQKEACIQRALSVAMSNPSTTDLAELLSSLERITGTNSCGGRLTAARNGSQMRGGGEPLSAEQVQMTLSAAEASQKSLSQGQDDSSDSSGSRPKGR